MKSSFTYERMEDEASIQERERTALRQSTWLTFEEEEALLPRSANYDAWKGEFIKRVESLRGNGIHSAKKIAQLLARQGFKTLSGDYLSARLVAVLRDKFRRDGDMSTPAGAKPASNEVGRAISKSRKAHTTYRPMPEPEIES